VQSTVSGGKLWLACNIQDLANDPDFGGWPSASGTLLFVGATMRVTVDLGSGTPEFGFGDYAGTALAYFDDHRYLAMANSLPQISNLSLNQQSGLLTFDYLDAEGLSSHHGVCGRGWQQLFAPAPQPGLLAKR